MPTPKPFVAIWDTGATNTVITSSVVNELSLSPSGRVTVVGVHGANETNTYMVNVILPNKVGCVGVRVSEGQLRDADVLIGMDIITSGDFAISNAEGKTCWTFRIPAVSEIDFVESGNQHNKKYGHVPLSDEEKQIARNKAKRERRGRRR